MKWMYEGGGEKKEKRWRERSPIRETNSNAIV